MLHFIVLYSACECMSTYHKSADASLWRFPFKAAVDVVACVDQEHDAAPNSVEVAQQQLETTKRQIIVICMTFCKGGAYSTLKYREEVKQK